MKIDLVFFLPVLGLVMMTGLCLFLFVQNTSIRSDNYFLGNAYIERDAFLTSICHIDLNEYNRQQVETFMSELKNRQGGEIYADINWVLPTEMGK